MKKLSSLVVFLLVCTISFAQSTLFLKNDPNVTPPSVSPVQADHIVQASDGCIGIGVDDISSGSGIIFGVSNQAAYSPTPNIISLVSNAVSPTNWPAPGNTPYSFAVARIPEDPNGPDGPIDFIVDGYGNTGLGVMDPASKFHIFNTTGNHPGNIPNSVQVDRQKFEYIGSGPGYNITTYNDFMITSDGLIGVGVSTPSAHLDIADQNNDGLPILRATA